MHWRGGALRLVDLVDYCHYMTPMCVLPPVPAVWGDGWDEEWRRRLETNEPWVLTWLRENRHGDYWRRRVGAARAPTARATSGSTVPTMIVAGWADGYRNNSFRTVAELAANGVPHRLLAGPWAHADPRTAMPGPRIDLDVEMAAWFDRWLREPRRPRGAYDSHCDVFVRSSTRPEPDLDLHEGYWLRLPSVPPTRPVAVDARGPALAGGPCPTPAPPPGSTAPVTCRGASPATSGSTTPAR